MRMGSSDFLPRLEEDMSFKILESLENPSDLVRASCVSHSWRQFVVGNSLCKQMCLRLFPQLCKVDRVVDPTSSEKATAEVGPSNSSDWENLEMEHRAFAFLAHCSSKPNIPKCIAEAVGASSTDNLPEETIDHTLDSRDRIGRIGSYWSSKGSKDSSAPERLIYRLHGDLCIVNEIGIQPFRAYFQLGFPIYSAKSVRFRMGHLKGSMDTLRDKKKQAVNETLHEEFGWTYTSPEFPMTQENCLQIFKLPEPVLCIGGFLLVELLGRVQRQEMDGRFYICITHVQVQGRPLSPVFGVKILEPDGKFALKVNKYDPSCLDETRRTLRVVHLGQIFNMLRGNVVGIDYEWDDEHDEEQDDSDSDSDEDAL